MRLFATMFPTTWPASWSASWPRSHRSLQRARYRSISSGTGICSRSNGRQQPTITACCGCSLSVSRMTPMSTSSGRARAKGDELLSRFGTWCPRAFARWASVTPADLWAPWCVATVEGEVASIVEAVRRGPAGAEVGVDTAVGWRGRGLAAAVTAAWSRHPELSELVLFYSTSRVDVSSQRVTARPSLRRLGATFAVS